MKHPNSLVRTGVTLGALLGALLGAAVLAGLAPLRAPAEAGPAHAGLPLSLGPGVPAVETEKETVAAARAAITAKEPQKAVDLIATYLKSAVAGYELHDVYGQALMLLGRRDEAAFHFGRALKLAGDTNPARKLLTANLSKADPLAGRSAALMRNVTKQLLETTQKLVEAGHSERALALLDQLEPIAVAPEKQAIVALAAKLRAANQEVDLDSESGNGNGEGEGGAEGDAVAVTHLEGAHYIFEARMERDLVQRVSDVMDDIFNYYVLIYFDGDASRVAPQKPTIQIHATHKDMLKDWQGPPTVGGWWSPGEWKVVCYDTRSDGGGSTDQMLMTLYHEASHHFMTMLAKGGGVPAWINEGTASFFEGAKAMEDRRVLWPDAASSRLQALNLQLKGSYPGPTPAQVISFNEPGSYPGEFYSYGWGLVYYLQQYEDPATLEYVFRPLYSKYREKIAKSGGDPMALFQEIFLTKDAPGGFTEFEPWAAQWRAWIQEQVYPLHFGARQRELRLDRVRRYVSAADLAQQDKAAKVPEAQLLARALGHLEYVRTKIDGETTIDPDLVVTQADVLERLGRPQGTAAILEQVLKLADDGEAELDPVRYEELEQRLTKLDAKNQPLRLAKTRSKNHAKTALKILEEYRASPVAMTLSAHEFAHAMAVALDNKELAAAAGELRLQAREAGLLTGALYSLGGRNGSWLSLFERPDETFEAGESATSLSGVKAVARLLTSVPLSGEYEIRCTLGRVGEISRTTTQGLVFAGTPTTPWFVLGIDGRGQLVLRRYAKGGSELTLKLEKLEPPVAKDENPALVVRVFEDGKLSIKVGERAAVEFQMEESMPKTVHVGVFAKNGAVELRSAVVEAFP